MGEKNIKSRIVNKHDIEENWLKAVNFIPKQGELIIYDVDDNYSYERFKIGDGINYVNDLPFSSNDTNANYLGYVIPIEDNEQKILPKGTIRTLQSNSMSAYTTIIPYVYINDFISSEKVNDTTIKFNQLSGICYEGYLDWMTCLENNIELKIIMNNGIEYIGYLNSNGIFTELSGTTISNNFLDTDILSLEFLVYYPVTQYVEAVISTGYTWQRFSRNIIIDSELSNTSTNAVQNKVITTEINKNKSDIEDLTTQIGDIEGALNEIIAIQEAYLGGDSV